MGPASCHDITTYCISRCSKDALFEPKWASVFSRCLCFLICKLVITSLQWGSSELRRSTSWRSSRTTGWGLPCFLFLSLLPSRLQANPICLTFNGDSESDSCHRCCCLAQATIISRLGDRDNLLNGIHHSSQGPATKTQNRSQNLPLKSLQRLLIWPEVKATRLCREHDGKLGSQSPLPECIFLYILMSVYIFRLIILFSSTRKLGWEVHEFLSILFTVSRTVHDTLKNLNK